MNTIKIKSYDGSEIEVVLVEARYKNDNSKAIQLMFNYGGSWEQYSILTVCIPDTELKNNEILVKTWSENEPLKSLLDTKIFSDTGKRIPSGYVLAEIWTIDDNSMLLTSEEFHNKITKNLH